MIVQTEGSMPIYEYLCGACSREFELLVRNGATPRCPTCQSEALQRKLSVFAVATTEARTASGPQPCHACGDPRGQGACSLN
jgi:putative FmdB family regulatory protein